MLHLHITSLAIDHNSLGKRTIQYFRAKADFFARGINGQCLRMRVVKYLDVAQTIVTEIHEW
jgi:sulfur transfer complex TusBCD TusB component (DsrH family)